MLPSIHIHALPNPSAQPELAPEPEPSPPVTPSAAPNPLRPYRQVIKFIMGLFLLVVALWWLWSRFGGRLRAHWRRMRELRRNSESAAFAKLNKAIRLGDAKETFRLLLIWLSRFQPGSNLDEFLSSCGDIELSNEVNSLAVSLYGREKAFWSHKLLITRLKHVRTRDRRKSPREMALPPLNL